MGLVDAVAVALKHSGKVSQSETFGFVVSLQDGVEAFVAAPGLPVENQGAVAVAIDPQVSVLRFAGAVFDVFDACFVGLEDVGGE